MRVHPETWFITPPRLTCTRKWRIASCNLASFILNFPLPLLSFYRGRFQSPLLPRSVTSAEWGVALYLWPFTHYTLHSHRISLSFILEELEKKKKKLYTINTACTMFAHVSSFCVSLMVARKINSHYYSFSIFKFCVTTVQATANEVLYSSCFFLRLWRCEETKVRRWTDRADRERERESTVYVSIHLNLVSRINSILWLQKTCNIENETYEPIFLGTFWILTAVALGRGSLNIFA